MTESNLKTNTSSSVQEQVQYSSFYLKETLCGINIDYVQEINEDLNITKVPLSPEYVMGIMNLRGQIVTIINLGMKIGFSPSIINPESRIMIVNSKGEKIGLLVDRVADVISTPKEFISSPPANIQGLKVYFLRAFYKQTKAS